MSQIIIQNKKNPTFKRSFPKRAWDLQSAKGALKQEWEYVENQSANDTVLPKSEIGNMQLREQSKIFIPPEVRDVVNRTNEKIKAEQPPVPEPKVTAQKPVQPAKAPKAAATSKPTTAARKTTSKKSKSKS